jgi:hypothetical protein
LIIGKFRGAFGRNNRHRSRVAGAWANHAPQEPERDAEDSVMADRWMDERDRDWRDRDWRDRDWRRSERFGRGHGRAEDDRRRDEERLRRAEPRSWSEEDESGLYEELSRDRRAYGDAGEEYGDRARSQAYRTGAIRARYSGPAPRFTSPDHAGRSCADEAADFRHAAREGFGGQRDWRDEDYGERRGGEGPMRGRDDYPDEPRRYRADFGREDHWVIAGGCRGLGPKGYRRSDERISEDAHDRLTDDPWLDATDVRVEVKGGEVTLSGHVDNREAKHRAERLVEDILGVGHVQNNLRVNPDAGLTGAGRGYGSSALEAEMRRNAEAERSTKAEVDPKTGQKRS